MSTDRSPHCICRKYPQTAKKNAGFCANPCPGLGQVGLALSASSSPAWRPLFVGVFVSQRSRTPTRRGPGSTTAANPPPSTPPCPAQSQSFSTNLPTTFALPTAARASTGFVRERQKPRPTNPAHPTPPSTSLLLPNVIVVTTRHEKIRKIPPFVLFSSPDSPVASCYCQSNTSPTWVRLFRSLSSKRCVISCALSTSPGVPRPHLFPPLDIAAVHAMSARVNLCFISLSRKISPWPSGLTRRSLSTPTIAAERHFLISPLVSLAPTTKCTLHRTTTLLTQARSSLDVRLRRG